MWETAELVHVLVKNKHGQEVSRARYLHQLGPSPVIYKCSAPNGGLVREDSIALFVSFSAKHSGEARWKEVLSSPKAAIAKWLKEAAGVDEILHIFEPTMRSDSKQQNLGSVVKVRAAHKLNVLRKSGHGGCFCKMASPKAGETTDSTMEFANIPLPLEQDLLSAELV